MQKKTSVDRSTARRRRSQRGPLDGFVKPHGLRQGASMPNHEQPAKSDLGRSFSLPNVAVTAALPTPTSLASEGLHIKVSSTWELQQSAQSE